MRRLGLRQRLTWSLIAVILITVVGVGVISTILVDRSLRGRLVEQALTVTEFNLTVLVPATGLPDDPGVADAQAAGLIDRFLRRGTAGAWIEFEDGAQLTGGIAPIETSPEFDRLVETGQVAYEFTTGPEGDVLVTGSLLPPDGPRFHFVTPAREIGAASRQVLIATGITGLLAVVVGALVASATSRRIVRPLADARQAAEDIAGGDLDVRVPVESEDELGKLAESFNEMADSLQTMVSQLDAARLREQRFVADVSHELRTPLTGLVNAARMLLDRVESGRASTDDALLLARTLDADVTRLRHLVEELLEISRLDRDGDAAAPIETDVAAFLAALVASRHPEATLTTDLAGPLLVEPRGLERIVGNLLDNARLHAPGAETAVAARTHDGHLVVTVADRGPGVTDAALPTLFDRFATGDPSRTGGTGLGLAIASQHARRLGGTLEAERRAEGGMLFTLRVPVVELLYDGDAPEMPGSDPESDNLPEETP